MRLEHGVVDDLPRLAALFVLWFGDESLRKRVVVTRRRSCAVWITPTTFDVRADPLFGGGAVHAPTMPPRPP